MFYHLKTETETSSFRVPSRLSVSLSVLIICVVGTKKLLGISKNICREVVIRLSARKRSVSRECGENMSYDWEKEKLSDSQLSSHFQDIQYCSNLKQKTVTCQVCGNRLK